MAFNDVNLPVLWKRIKDYAREYVDKRISDAIPSKTSQLDNDVGYITKDDVSDIQYDTASIDKLGCVRVDGVTIISDNGVISVGIPDATNRKY